MKTREHVFGVTVYYEDTDITGVVYHANYLKYFERARSELLGADRLRLMQHDEGLAILVYQVQMRFLQGAELGDRLEIRSRPQMQGAYRVVVPQRALRSSDGATLVEATVELVCVANRSPVRVPDWIVAEVEGAGG
jgi:acyl-CoA thioester hydrolase